MANRPVLKFQLKNMMNSKKHFKCTVRENKQYSKSGGECLRVENIKISGGSRPVIN